METQIIAVFATQLFLLFISIMVATKTVLTLIFNQFQIIIHVKVATLLVVYVMEFQVRVITVQIITIYISNFVIPNVQFKGIFKMILLGNVLIVMNIVSNLIS